MTGWNFFNVSIRSRCTTISFAISLGKKLLCCEGKPTSLPRVQHLRVSYLGAIAHTKSASPEHIDAFFPTKEQRSASVLWQLLGHPLELGVVPLKSRRGVLPIPRICDLLCRKASSHRVNLRFLAGHQQHPGLHAIKYPSPKSTNHEVCVLTGAPFGTSLSGI